MFCTGAELMDMDTCSTNKKERGRERRGLKKRSRRRRRNKKDYHFEPAHDTFHILGNGSVDERASCIKGFTQVSCLT